MCLYNTLVYLKTEYDRYLLNVFERQRDHLKKRNYPVHENLSNWNRFRRQIRFEAVRWRYHNDEYDFH